MSDLDDDCSSADETASTPDRIFVPDENDKTPRYDKMTMLQLATSKLSTTRPDILSTEFNNDVGLWSPELWLEWKWATEGAETRGAAARRKHREVEKIKTEHPTLDAQGETVVLSPQRRGFVGGCRPTSPKPNEQSDHRSERIGADRRDWRSGAAGFGSKQQTSTERDFKPQFQKLATGGSGGGGSSSTAVPSSSAYAQRSVRGGGGGSSNSSWRDAPRGPAGDSSNSNNFHPSFSRDRDNRFGGGHQQMQQQQRRPWNNSYDRRSEERMPEWFDDGPENVTDVIELKGFDDDPNTSGGARQNGQGKENDPQSAARNNFAKRGGAVDRKEPTMVRGGGQQQQQQQQQQQGQHQPQQQQQRGGGNGRSGAAPSTKDAKPTTNGSRPSSRGGPPSMVGGNQRASPRPSSKGNVADHHQLPTLLPESDLDFAALLGLVDIPGAGKTSPPGQQVFSPIENGQPKAEGSRFSRFFGAGQSANGAPSQYTQNQPNRAQQQQSPPSHPTSASAMMAMAMAAGSAQQQPALLQQLFGRPAPSSQQQAQPQQLQPPPLGRALKGMTLEELEKSMMKSDDETLMASPPARYSGNRPTSTAEEEHRLLMRTLDNKAGLTRQQLATTQIAKGNPLCDPKQQAQFLSKLSSLERRQFGLEDKIRTPTPPHQQHSGGMDEMSQQAAMMMGSEQNQAMMAQAALMAQYQAAVLQALASNPRLPLSPAATPGSQMQPPQRGPLPAHLRGSLPPGASAGGPPIPPEMLTNPTVRLMFMQMMQQMAAAGSPMPAPLKGPSPPLPSGGGHGQPSSFSQFPPSSSQSSRPARNDASSPQHVRSQQQQQAAMNPFMPTSVLRQMMNKQQQADENAKEQHPSHQQRTSSDGKHPSSAGLPLEQQFAAADKSLAAANKSAQQQYATAVAAMSAGLSMGAWRPPALTPTSHSSQPFPAAAAAAAAMNPAVVQQALRAQVIQQQQQAMQLQMALQAAIVRNDPVAVQAARQRLTALQLQHIQLQQQLSQQPSTPTSHFGQQPPSGGGPSRQQRAPSPLTQQNQLMQQLMMQSSQQQQHQQQQSPVPPVGSQPLQQQQQQQQHKYPNPLEKLLQSVASSAGGGDSPGSMSSASSTNRPHQPSILSRLPPSAQSMSVEELEKRLAGRE